MVTYLFGGRSQVSVIKRSDEFSAIFNIGNIVCFGSPVALNNVTDMLDINVECR